ncbi:hypothetical protein BHYA_0015g00200 [Botrytis hyacinthi]|uniref:Secreted protein n=1 Tax=Botrytis hyacinthi TaxID=278943 RepID=A0A4Z1HA00_9HELO|nr:hypothetical protein BHYA_0015g00200 [Botrytis hyacinthi]
MVLVLGLAILQAGCRRSVWSLQLLRQQAFLGRKELKTCLNKFVKKLLFDFYYQLQVRNRDITAVAATGSRLCYNS